MDNNFIKRIKLENYKSIKSVDIELSNLNVLIGANGSGKSNFISFFTLLQKMQSGKLSSYVLDKGGVNSFLCYGILSSKHIGIELEIGFDKYSSQLLPTNNDYFRFGFENFTRHREWETNNQSYESVLYSKDNIGTTGSSFIDKLRKIQVFHFHDTSDTSALKGTVANNDNLYLRSDGANLACMLKLIHDKYNEYYRIIVETIQIVVPDFHDFVIRDSEFLSLEWFNKNNVDIPWKAHYLSDGSLRFIALATLLLMPTELQPETIIIDEPELGLHPTAIDVVSGLIKRASLDKQVIISTQSPALLNNFELEDIIVVDKKDKYSEFKRLDRENLKNWLEDFSLSEMWISNIFGGRP